MKILAACSPGEVQVAVVDGGVLEAFALWRPGRPDGVGDVYRARVIAHVPGLAGAFVALPDGDGFLPDSDGGAGAIEGRLLTVRITRAAQGGKGPRVSGRVAQSDGAPGLVARGPGPIEEFAARYPDADILADDPAIAAELRPLLGERIGFGATAFDSDVAEQVAGLSDATFALPGGMRGSVYPTPALVAIDLDMAGATASRQGKASAQLAANLAAMPELARQIRLRNLSGAILVDPAGLGIKRRALLRPALEAALAGDALRPRLLGFTQLGLAEIMRPRVRPPLHELRAGPYAAGLAALRAIARESATPPHKPLRLVGAPDVLAAVASDAVALSDLARRTGRALVSRSDPALPPGAWRIESAL